MTSVIDFEYDTNCIEKIKDWRFGKNWPIVYIIYNDTNAYVGETLDAVRRTNQHLQELEFSCFTKICLISNKTFNKSVILDLESFLIKYMSADATRELTNGNAGVVDHDYFYKEAYSDDFKEIWNALKERGIVRRSIDDIENSELFKYSPYKSLNAEQHSAAYEILRRIREINNTPDHIHTMVRVQGGAGTGKTILAVYLVKLLADIINNREIWKSVDDSEDASFIEKASGEFAGIRRIGFVVPMKELRETMKTIFKSVDGLDETMVISPKEVVKKQYDVLFCDEAHRLYQRNHLPGSDLYIKFDEINKSMMAEKFTGTIDDFTELDWIIKKSRIQVVFYDEFQTIRVTDIGPERFDQICRNHVYKKYINLFSQMRCKGGNGYYEYVRDVVSLSRLNIGRKSFPDYSIRVFDHIEDLFSAINDKNDEVGLCRVVTGPGWSINEDIIIESHTYHWAKSKRDNNSGVIFSIHKTQGFDLNYSGVIFGKEVFYDQEKKCISVNRKELKDSFAKSKNEEEMRQYIMNIYITLMTRAIQGTFVYAVDESLREYLKSFWG